MATPWESLSRNQKSAVLHDTGPSAVFAGPGSGKTRVVTLRAAQLVMQGKSVLVTTFTNDATQEMRHRVEQLVDKANSSRAHVTTLHSLCLSILRKQKVVFQLLTDEFQRKSLAEAAQAAELNGGIGGFLSLTSYLKNQGKTAATYQHDGSSEDRDFLFAWRDYEKRKAEKGLREFDDLILDAQSLLEQDESVRKSFASVYSHIIVDECQDMNAPQYAIVFALGKDHKNVMLVGDMDQSLYGFRGADTETFRRFSNHPRTVVYELRENYRSTRSIIHFADSIIRQDEERHPLVFLPTRSEGDPVQWHRFSDPDIEAIAVGEQILRLHKNGANYLDMALLYRTNAQSEAIERNFAALEIPYTMKESGDFYARREIQGLLAYLHFFADKDNSGATGGDEWLLALMNVPNRKLSRVTGGQLRNYAEIRGKRIWEVLTEFHADSLQAHKSLRSLREELLSITAKLPAIKDAGEAIKIIRRATYFDDWLKKSEKDEKDNDRLQNVQRMQSAASHYATIADYLAAVQKVRDEAARRKAERAKKRKKEEAVTLCTGHSAKGLEWRFVFAIGWSEQILPHHKAEDIAEERRIAYVMATRAKDRLVISSIESWNDAITEPSRFLMQAQILPTATIPAEEETIERTEKEELIGGLFLVDA